MTLVHEHDGDYPAIVKFLEERMRDHFTVSERDPVPEGHVAEALARFPYNFGDRFPLGAVSELGHEGLRSVGGRSTVPAPALIDVGVRIYTPSLLGDDALGPVEYEDGREEARDIARAVYEKWRRSFLLDDELEGLVRTIQMGRMVDGDHDQIGNPFFVPGTTSTILWTFTVPVRFTL